MDSEIVIELAPSPLSSRIHIMSPTRKLWLEMLLELTSDGSPRVRETAAAALDEIKAARDPAASESRGSEFRAFLSEPARILETIP